MKIVIITQDEPFYLAENLRYLIKILPTHSKIVACVVNDVSPFGRKETFLLSRKKDIWYIWFEVFYTLRFKIFTKYDW